MAVWEFTSIVDGVHAADEIAKGSPVETLLSGTTHPGKYVVLVAGDTASVEVALGIVDDMGVGVIDARFLPDIAESVADAVTSEDTSAHAAAEAIGVVEVTGVAAGVDAADAATKAADVTLGGLRLADGIGGKAYFVVDGSVGEVEAAVDAARERAGAQLVASVVIPQLTRELREDLAASAKFLHRMRAHGRARRRSGDGAGS